MADKKVYSIVINGIEETTTKVASLNEMLKAMDEKIKAFQSAKIEIQATSVSTDNSVSTEKTGELRAQDAILKQIAATETQIANAQMEDYQRLLASKDVLKEQVNLQKERAAAERLAAGEYANSMAGMKQQLADIKQVLNFKDLNDEGFDALVKKADSLNSKLKEVEQSYGQFGRNVGNYASAAQGFNSLKVAVGGTVREFGSAKEAAKTLSNELKTMALNGQQGTEAYKELQKALLSLNSTIKDATISSQGMDKMLDTMTSVMAIASTAQGIGTLFGMDNSKINESIQKMLALQNALKGIETIRQQFKTGEFFGGIFNSANASIDNFSKKVFGIKDATNVAVEGEKQLTTATNTMAASSKNAAATQATMNATIVNTGKVSRAAALGVKVLSTALKTIGIGLIIWGVTELIGLIDDWINKESDAEKEAKRLAEVTEAGAKAYAKQRAELSQTITAVNSFNGTKKQEEALVKQLNSQYGKTLGTYKTLAQWKETLKKKTDALVESMRLEAEMNVLIRQYEEAYAKQLEAEEKLRNRTYETSAKKSQQQEYEAAERAVNEYASEATKALDRIQKKAEEISRQQQKNGLGIFAPNNTEITKSGNSQKEAYKKAQQTINDAVMALMQDGLRKQLIQLQKERADKIAEIRKNGQLVGEATLAVERQYQQKEAELVRQHFEKMAEEREKYERQIQDMVATNRQRNLSTSETNVQNYVDRRSTEGVQKTHTTGISVSDTDIVIDNMMANLDKLDQRLSDTKGKFLTFLGTDDWMKSTISDINAVISEISILKKHIDYVTETINYKKKFDIDTSSSEAQLANLQKAVEKYEGVLAELPKDIVDTYRETYSVISDGTETTYANIFSALRNTRSELIKLRNEGKENTEEYRETAEQVRRMEALTTMSIESAIKIRTEAWETYYQSLNDIAKLEAARYEQIEQEKIQYDDRSFDERLREYEKMVGTQIGISEKAMEELKRQEKQAADGWRPVEVFTAEYLGNAITDLKTGTGEMSRILEAFKKRAADALAIGGDEQTYFNDLEKDLQEYLQKRESEMQAAALRIAQIEKTEATNRTAAQNQEYNNLKAIVERYNEEIGTEITDSYRKGELSFADYMRTMENMQTAFENEIISIIKDAIARRQAIENESRQKQRDANTTYMNNMVNELQTTFSTIEQHMQRVTQRTTKMGIVPVAKNAQDLTALQNATDYVMERVMAKIREVQDAYKKGLLTDEAYQNIIGQLQNLYNQIQSMSAGHQQRMDENLQNWTQGINNYVQMFGQQLSQITQNLFQVQENWMQQHIDRLSEQIDREEELMEKHRDNAEMHADKVNDIESQLATARGSRRQELIDQLNAQIMAQRRELAEQQKAEKKKKQLEAQKEKEEKKLSEQKKKNAVKQAIISGALAVANGLATAPFVPVGIAMGALAGALTAAQIAVINSTKYEKGGQLATDNGGVAQGPRHSHGGIKVLGGRAEIEGGEFITNRLTTSRNVEVLEFINSRRRKLDLSDFIDFYTDRKGIASNSVRVVRTSFANGGEMPAMSGQAVSTDRLLKAVHEYAERPIYVSVQEIEDVREDMQKVKALAGYE